MEDKVEPPENRICTICKQEKPLATAFRRQVNGKHGRQSACKPCANAVVTAYRQTPEGKAKYQEYARRHREKPGYAEKHRQYRERPEPLWKLYRAGAVKRGLDFQLTLEDFEARFWQKPCWYCGEAIPTAGVDRIDNAKGYTNENTVSCCTTCNLMKRKSGQEEFLAKCVQIARLHGG